MNPKPSYFAEFLTHPYNRLAMMSAGCAAILASIPYGWNGLWLVSIVALGVEVLAALMVPDLPLFRAAVDRTQQSQVRSVRLTKLLTELKAAEAARAPGVSSLLENYRHMCDRVQELYQRVTNSGTGLARADVEKLDDLTIDYLGLGLLIMSLAQRQQESKDDTAIRRITAIQAQLRQTLPADEERQLRDALSEYTDVVNRARRLAVRRSSLEARLIAMPDKLEEVYQLVMTSPYSDDMGDKLEESLARLRLVEEVAAEFDDNPAPTTVLLVASSPSAIASSATKIQTDSRQPPRALKT